MKQIQKKLFFKDPSYEFAHKIIATLKAKGFDESYLVGGCIRDDLLGIEPKDFDISTSATPQQIKRCISRTFLIGNRFRLALVKRSPFEFEVSTFRTNAEEPNTTDPAPRDNVYGTPEEDTFRRDFTINGLFYDPIEHIIFDHTEQGLSDLNQGVIRTIGDPYLRLEQDPIRILRAIRLAHKINFTLERTLRQACEKKGCLLEQTNLSRRREEFLKFLKTPSPDLTWLSCFDFNILKFLSPTLYKLFQNKDGQQKFCYLLRQTKNTFSLSETPTYLLSNFLTCYLSALGETKIFQLKDRQKDDLSIFLKQELGASNLETDFAIKAIEGIKRLLEPPQKTHLGATLYRKSLPLSLWLAESHHLIAPEKIEPWWDALESLHSTN